MPAAFPEIQGNSLVWGQGQPLLYPTTYTNICRLLYLILCKNLMLLTSSYLSGCFSHTKQSINTIFFIITNNKSRNDQLTCLVKPETTKPSWEHVCHKIGKIYLTCSQGLSFSHLSWQVLTYPCVNTLIQISSLLSSANYPIPAFSLSASHLPHATLSLYSQWKPLYFQHEVYGKQPSTKIRQRIKCKEHVQEKPEYTRWELTTLLT